MKKYLPTSTGSTTLTTSSLSVNKKGFTLIELMVVVTIIAFLSVIGIVAFTNIQAQARDGRRRADIDAVATALEANRDPVAGTYPTVVYSSTSNPIFADSKVPRDPLDADGSYSSVSYGGVNYIYTFTSTTSLYTVCARLEKGNGNSSDTSGTTATGASATHYCRKNQQ